MRGRERFHNPLLKILLLNNELCVAATNIDT